MAALTVAFAAMAQTAPAEEAPAPPIETHALADGTVEGASLGAWTAQWWRWAMGQWIEPYLDPDGRLCDIGQHGPVWFLAGTDGSFNPKRTCIVPDGKYLLLPVINMIHMQARNEKKPTACKDLQRRAAVNNDHLVSAVVLLDGKPLGDIRLHRVRSDGCFPLDPNDANPRLAAADGYWLMLKPLPRGRHTLVVGANYGAADRAYGRMHQNFEYVLEVGGRGLMSWVEGVPRRGEASG